MSHKFVNTENNWTFERGLKSGIDVSFYVSVVIMQRNQFFPQNRTIDTFHRPTVRNAQCKTGSENYPDARLNCNYTIDLFSQAYGKFICCFRHLDNFKDLQQNITQKDFVTS